MSDMGITEPDLVEAARKVQDLEIALQSNPGKDSHSSISAAEIHLARLTVYLRYESVSCSTFIK